MMCKHTITKAGTQFNYQRTTQTLYKRCAVHSYTYPQSKQLLNAKIMAYGVDIIPMAPAASVSSTSSVDSDHETYGLPIEDCWNKIPIPHPEYLLEWLEKKRL